MRHALEQVATDARFALRWMRRSPAFFVTAVLSLAVGIGANAAIFTLINLVLWRPLPVPAPEQLVLYTSTGPGAPIGRHFSFRQFQTLREQSVAETAAYAPLRVTLATGDATDSASALAVSGTYSQVIGLPPWLGRLITANDDRAGSARVVVLSHDYWQRRFGGNPAVIGRLTMINGLPFTVVGVWPARFTGSDVGEPFDLTIPLAVQPEVMGEQDRGRTTGAGADDLWLEMIGRLPDGVTIQQAQVQLQAITPSVRLAEGGRGFSPLRQRLSQPLLVVMAAVGLVLLVAGANVTTLLLSRAAARQPEMAVRLSLGASRGRLVRQHVTESLVLAGFGGLGGFVAATWTAQLAARLVDTHLDVSGADTTMLLFTITASMVTGLVIGLAAASASWSRMSAAPASWNTRTVIGGGPADLRGVLVASQVALSLVLLVGTGLFVRTTANLQRLDLGLEQGQVLITRLEPVGSNQKTVNEARLRRIYSAILDRVRVMPGVVSASLSGSTPLGGENPLSPLIRISRRDGPGPEESRIRMMQVYPDYFATLGVRILAGRDLLPQDDRADAAPVAVINDAMARRFFGGAAAAVGASFATANGRSRFDIVGVVADTRERTLREATGPMAYATFAKTPTGRGQMTLLVRTTGDSRALAGDIRKLLPEVDAAMPLHDLQTLDDRVSVAMRDERLVATLSSIFGVLSLVLAAIGLYGVIAHSVASRRREFGVRLALGATPRGLEHRVLRQSWTLVAVGAVVGVLLSMFASRAVSGMLFGIAPFDPISVAAALLLLFVVSTAAAWLPARAAAGTDPGHALRQD